MIRVVGEVMMMNMYNLYLIRGVSGSGKSTLRSNLLWLPNVIAYETDDFWNIKNVKFDYRKLDEAHQWCFNSVERCMCEYKINNIIVSNTFTTEKELQPYFDLAKKYGYTVFSLVVENRHNGINVHNVPKKTLETQERRLRSSIKLG